MITCATQGFVLITPEVHMINVLNVAKTQIAIKVAYAKMKNVFLSNYQMEVVAVSMISVSQIFVKKEDAKETKKTEQDVIQNINANQKIVTLFIVEVL